MKSLSDIVAAVSARMGLTPHDVKYGSGRGVRDARHAVFFVASRYGYSGLETAQALGVDDHTVARGLERMETLLAALVAEGGA